MTITDKRREFLTDILLTADVHYWAETDVVLDGDNLDNLVSYRITYAREDGAPEERIVTLQTIERGLAMLRHPSSNYHNSGYRSDYHGSTQQRFAQLSSTDGDEGDYDATDADAIVQLGLFGKVVFG